MEFLEELQTWWQSTTPETRAALQTGLQIGGLVLLGLIAGHFLAALVTRTLRGWDFDASLRVPGSAAAADAARGLTPTRIAGVLTRLTVWAAVAWWLAHKYGRTDIAATLALVVYRAWALAAVLTAALALGGLLSSRLIEALHALPRPEQASLLRNGAPTPHRSAAGAVGAAVYAVVGLLVLLIAADLFDWPLTRNSALALWGLTQHLLIAGAALFIGGLGARWARDLATMDTSSPERRAGQYTALGITAATTVLAVSVVLAGAGLVLGLAALAVLGFLLWLGRGYLPDVAAGLQLRAHHASEVWFDGIPWQVAEVGLVTTQLARAGEFCRLQNRVVLEARMRGAPMDVEEPVAR